MPSSSGIKVNTGFVYGAATPSDNRNWLTKAEMLTIDENLMPNPYYAICRDDGMLYTYSSLNETSEETGKFTPISAGGGGKQLQFTVMPTITPAMEDSVLQYIGETDQEYNKGSWYGVVEDIALYAFNYGTNVYFYTKKPLEKLDAGDFIYDANGEQTGEVANVDVDAMEVTAIGGDVGVYTPARNVVGKIWKELLPEELSNAISSMNFSGGKIWTGSKEDFEALDPAIKNNRKIMFVVWDDNGATLINDDVVALDSTLSSTFIYANFLTNTADNLVNYYNKENCYSKAEINALISETLTYTIVEQLPAEGDTHTVYLILNGDAYDQYMYIGGDFVKIGSTSVDFTDYYTKDETDDLLESKPSTFTGTSEEWEALSVAEKDEFEIINFTDDDISQEIEYSTAEQYANKKWIDGKKIYRKVVDCGTLLNNDSKVIPHNISNFGFLVSATGVWYKSNSWNPLPFPSTILENSIVLGVNATNITITTGTDRTMWSAYVILEYTKTTD